MRLRGNPEAIERAEIVRLTGGAIARNNARDVRAMAMTVVAIDRIRRETHCLVNVQIGMCEIDARVEDCNIRIHAFIQTIDLRCR